MDENNEQFVAYFLPTPDTLRTRHSEEAEALEGDHEQELVSLSEQEKDGGKSQVLRTRCLLSVGMSIR